MELAVGFSTSHSVAIGLLHKGVQNDPCHFLAHTLCGLLHFRVLKSGHAGMIATLHSHTDMVLCTAAYEI